MDQNDDEYGQFDPLEGASGGTVYVNTVSPDQLQLDGTGGQFKSAGQFKPEQAEAEAEAVKRPSAAEAVVAIVDARVGEAIMSHQDMLMSLHDRVTKLEGQLELLARMIRSGTAAAPKPKPKL